MKRVIGIPFVYCHPWRLKVKAETTDVDYVPKALREVWEWKDEIYQEVKHLPTREALRAILKKAEKTAVELGFGEPRVSGKHKVVAESPVTYGVARPRTKSDFLKKIRNTKKRNKK
jgi:hypothetical protein